MKHVITVLSAVALCVSLFLTTGCDIQSPGQSSTQDQSDSGKKGGKGKMEADEYIPPAPGDEEDPSQDQGLKVEYDQNQGQKQSQKQGQKQEPKQDQDQDQDLKPEQK